MSTEPATFEAWWPGYFRDRNGMSQGVLARAAWDQATKSAADGAVPTASSLSDLIRADVRRDDTARKDKTGCYGGLTDAQLPPRGHKFPNEVEPAADLPPEAEELLSCLRRFLVKAYAGNGRGPAS